MWTYASAPSPNSTGRSQLKSALTPSLSRPTVRSCPYQALSKRRSSCPSRRTSVKISFKVLNLSLRRQRSSQSSSMITCIRRLSKINRWRLTLPTFRRLPVQFWEVNQPNRIRPYHFTGSHDRRLFEDSRLWSVLPQMLSTSIWRGQVQHTNM